MKIRQLKERLQAFLSRIAEKLIVYQGGKWTLLPFSFFKFNGGLK